MSVLTASHLYAAATSYTVVLNLVTASSGYISDLSNALSQHSVQL